MLISQAFGFFYCRKDDNRLFGESEQLSSNTVFSNKTMLGGIGKNLRAKVQFISTNVSNHYDALKLTIINREQGQIDIETFRFVDIIGKKNG